MSLNAEVWSQEQKINLRLGDTNLEVLFEEMQAAGRKNLTKAPITCNL